MIKHSTAAEAAHKDDKYLQEAALNAQHRPLIRQGVFFILTCLDPREQMVAITTINQPQKGD